MNSEAVHMDVAELLTGFQHNVLRSDWSDRSGLCHRWQQKSDWHGKPLISQYTCRHASADTFTSYADSIFACSYVTFVAIHVCFSTEHFLPFSDFAWVYNIGSGFWQYMWWWIKYCDHDNESNVRGLRGTIYMRKVHETQYTPDGTFVLYCSSIGVLLDTVRTSISTAVILCHNHV